MTCAIIEQRYLTSGLCAPVGGRRFNGAKC
jgi:hypothetical protein